MRLLVAVKRVVDYNVRVRPRADGQGVDLAGVKMSVNPFDENALEQAIRLKEQGVASEVVAVSLGEAGVVDALRAALALGADRAIHGLTQQPLDQLAVAKVLAQIVRREAVDIVLLGKQAIDEDAGQVAPMLAALLDWPQAVATSSLTVADGRLDVTREIDGGTESLCVTLPAVVSADLRLNQPRFVKLPDLMKARRLPIECVEVASLGLDLAPRVVSTQVAEPAARAVGVRVETVSALVEKLRDEAKVIA